MAFKKGHKKVGGRAKGVKNKKTQELEKALTEKARKYGIESPKQFLFDVMADRDLEMGVRIDAAKAAAPYFDARKSEIKADVNVPSLSDFVKEREGK